MEKLSMCRICLVENVLMYKVRNRNLHELYEKLTSIPFVTEDSRPILACFFCCAKLKQCYQLLRKCLEAEELFARMVDSDLNEDYEPNSKPILNQDHLEFFSGFTRSPIEYISIVDECQTESIAVKDELPAVCERLDDIIEPMEEHLREELEPENFDNSYLDVADIPTHSESDSEDDVVEEQEVSKKIRRARETKNYVQAKIMPPQSSKERREKKRLAEISRRARIKNDTELHNAVKMKARDRYYRRKAEGKVIPVSEVSSTRKRAVREQNRIKSRLFHQREKMRERELCSSGKYERVPWISKFS